MNSHWFILAVAFTFLWAAGRPARAAEEPVACSLHAVAATNELAVDLYGRLMEQEKGNLFFSPYSIETALAMTYAGARGQTAQQMAQTLHFDLPPDKVHAAFADLIQTLNQSGGRGGGDQRAFDLSVANALWAQRGLAIDGKFLDLTKKQYGANLEQLDFAGGPAALEQARGTINDWVAKQTHDKIKDLIGPGALSKKTRLVLTNAIYFKSAWMTSFKKNATEEEPFLLDATHKATVSMMHQSHHFGYLENPDLQVLQLPYALNKLSMVVLLPRKADGLPALEKSLSAKTVDGWIGSLNYRSGDREVEVSLPKFTFTSRFELGKTLQAMGMVDAFSDKADFSGITTASSLKIDQVIHQAFIAVDEEGTEAAAATAVTFAPTAMRRPDQPVVFRADHPFLFLIRDNASGTILFFGRVTNPKE